jgi:hypothetical protein
LNSVPDLPPLTVGGTAEQNKSVVPGIYGVAVGVSVKVAVGV